MKKNKFLLFVLVLFLYIPTTLAQSINNILVHKQSPYMSVKAGEEFEIAVEIENLNTDPLNTWGDWKDDDTKVYLIKKDVDNHIKHIINQYEKGFFIKKMKYYIPGKYRVYINPIDTSINQVFRLITNEGNDNIYWNIEILPNQDLKCPKDSHISEKGCTCDDGFIWDGEKCFIQKKVLDIINYKQKYTLSCEIASLKILLAFYQIDTTEQDIIDRMPFYQNRIKDNIWGDPHIQFVGDINGARNKKLVTGYGVFADPLKKITRDNYGIVFNSRQTSITKEFLKNLIIDNKPAILWIGMNGHVSKGPDVQNLSWNTEDGKMIKTPLNEHTVVLYGFENDDFYIMDVYDGRSHQIKYDDLEPMMAQMHYLMMYRM